MTNLFITVVIPAEQHFISFKELLACLCVINVCSISKFLNSSILQDGRLISVHFVCLFVCLARALSRAGEPLPPPGFRGGRVTVMLQ